LVDFKNLKLVDNATNEAKLNFLPDEKLNSLLLDAQNLKLNKFGRVRNN
jgi:hypothetical protein